MSETAELGFYRPPPAQRRPGFIYLLLRSDGLHKIGSTGNVESRLQSLRSQHKPLTVELIHAFPCVSMRDAEDGLHRHFANKRVEGEWFALDEPDVAQVLRIKRMGQERKSTPLSVVFPQVHVWYCEVGVERYTHETLDFRLLCNGCGRPATLRVFRNWGGRYAPLMLQAGCVACKTYDRIDFWHPVKRDAPEPEEAIEDEAEPPAWERDEYSQA